MRIKLATFAILLIATGSLISCGGGGGGGGAPPKTAPATSISGSVAPLPSLSAAPPLPSTAPTMMLFAPGSPNNAFPAIAQTLDYSFDPNERTLLKVTALNFARPLDPGASFTPYIDAAPFPGDNSLGQPNGIDLSTNWGLLTFALSGSPAVVDTLGSFPAFLVDRFSPNIIGYVIPFSSTANPAGFVYQTFGSWIDDAPVISGAVEGYFSAGIPVDASTLLTAGSATYAGALSGSLVEVANRDLFDVIATVGVTVDFAARTVTFTTTGTTVLSANAAAATPYTSRPDLNLQGVMTYIAGSNTYSGTVSAANGISGNVTGRLYGAGIGSATSSKDAGSPPEVGGTFALKLDGFGAMQGAFGGK